MSMRSRLIKILGNAGFILLFAFAAGLIFNGAASWTKAAMVPVLGVVMTLSVMSISSDIFRDLKSLSRQVAVSMVLNYVLLAGVLIGLSHLLVRDQQVLAGFILVAAVPPAVAVIPYTYHLGGNVAFSLVGSVAAYLGALFITPLICILSLGTNFIEPTKLVIILVELIIGPLALSRVLRRTPLAPTLERYRGPVVNWGFFVIVYTIVGLNRDVFLGQPETLLRVSAVAFACTFLLGESINRLSGSLGADPASRISLTLLGTRKNYGLASAIAVVFFSDRAAIPSTVGTAFAIMHFIWLTVRATRSAREPSPQQTKT